MRKIKTAVVILFAVSLVVFVAYNVISRMTADRIPPSISCDTDTISVSVAAAEEELMEGITAEDNVDGDLTGSVRVASLSRFTEKGKRTIEYMVFDSSNQAATLTRNLEYTDYTSPKIMLSRPLRVSLDEVGQADLTEGISVQDCLDGDISNKVRITYNNDVDVSTEGSYQLTAQVSNSAGDTCTVPLELTVVDGTSSEENGKYYPMLSQYIVYTGVGQPVSPMDYLTGFVQGEREYTMDSLPAGVDPAGVVVGGAPDYNTPGTYILEYSYTSASGAVAVTKLAVVVGG